MGRVNEVATHLIWSFHLGFFVTEPKQGGHSTTIENPGSKTEVVYECFKATWVGKQHNPRNDTLYNGIKDNNNL